MRLSHFFTVLATVLLLPAVAVAEAAPGAPASPGVESAADATTPMGAESLDAKSLAADAFEEAAFEAIVAGEQPPAAPSGTEVTPSDASATTAATTAVKASVDESTSRVTASGVVLGPEGVDDQGRTGRLHTVARGDTLWDLSAAYLGTPWVWPSVWTDNDDIANPHLILPGDKIWITATEMRVVTDAEAESFLAPVVVEAPVAAEFDALPVEEIPPLAALETSDEAATLDAFPVAIPGQEPTSMESNRQITVASREMMGFLSAETLAGSSTLVESKAERTYLSTGDPVVAGIGEGDTEVGDQFTIFNLVEEVRDVETNRVLGQHVEILGWIEIKELTGDTSIGEIRQAYAGIPRGSKIVARENLPRRVTVRTTPDAIEGHVVFLPYSRTVMADGGYVYLNRGEFHGVEVGSELEVFDGGSVVNERARRVDVRTPDQRAATLVVVSVEAETSVAFVLNAQREIQIGDRVRPVVSQMARR